jgi:aldose 1-epimerase
MLAVESPIDRRAFGRTREGAEVRGFTLRGAGGLAVEVLEYGAVIRSLRVPDRWGRCSDVVLGYDQVSDYERDPFYLGAVVGRSTGRIRGGALIIDGQRVQLTVNDGVHHLHGGAQGLSRALWRGEPFEDGDTAGVVLTHRSPHGAEGYPGDLDVRVTYTVTPNNVLGVDYHAVTDRATPVNLTQHSYFNLAGEGSGDVLGHELTVYAEAYTPLGRDLIPTGRLAPVAGTALDFRAPHPIGAGIDSTEEQIRIGGGYDHNFALRPAAGALAPAALLSDPASGRVLEVFTSEPGMQLYTGNFLDGTLPGKQGHRYGRRAGVCLETQHFPDAPNQPGFASTLLRPGEVYRSRTEFRFSHGNDSGFWLPRSEG